MNLAYPVVEYLPVNGTVVWRAVININKVEPFDIEVPWNGTSLRLRDKNGTLVGTWTDLGLCIFDFSVEWSTLNTLNTSAWVIETMSGDTHMNAGDAISITGLDPSLKGATIEVWVQDHIAAKVVLPDEFP
jgi:hypothetical protein